MAGFVAGLDPINAAADLMPGFVWRLQDDAGDATSIRAFDNQWILINLTVWESTNSLKDFIYHSSHVEYARRGKNSFEILDRDYFVMW